MDDSIWKWFQLFKSNYKDRFMYQACSVYLLKSCGFNRSKNSGTIINATGDSNACLSPGLCIVCYVCVCVGGWGQNKCIYMHTKERMQKANITMIQGFLYQRKQSSSMWEFLQKYRGNGEVVMHSSHQWKLMEHAFFICSLFESVAGDITSGTTTLSHVIPLITSSGR